MYFKNHCFSKLVVDIQGSNVIEQSSRNNTSESAITGIVKSIKDAILDAKEGFRTVFKQRPNNDRRCLILLITAYLLEMFTNYQWGNFFMYFRLKLQFRMADFSTLIAITGWVGLSAQYIFVPLFIKALRFHDATISLLGNP